MENADADGQEAPLPQAADTETTGNAVDAPADPVGGADQAQVPDTSSVTSAEWTIAGAPAGPPQSFHP